KFSCPRCVHVSPWPPWPAAWRKKRLTVRWGLVPGGGPSAVLGQRRGWHSGQLRGLAVFGDCLQQSLTHLGPMALGIRFERATTMPRLEANGLLKFVDGNVSRLAFSRGHPAAFATKRLQCRDGGTEERDQLWRDLAGDALSHRSTPASASRQG